MAQKVVNLPGIGDVIVAKRRGTKNIRLSVQPDGRIRVGIPAWAPYETGVRFAKSREDWIRNHLDKRPDSLLKNGQRIGKSYRLNFDVAASETKTSSRVSANQINVRTSKDISDPVVQKSASAGAERALKKDAEKLLPIRLKELSVKNGLQFRSIKVKKLKSRWGSCSSRHEITLNYYLIQLPWRLIDYVILHELCHTVHMNHSPAFWEEMDRLLPEVKKARKELHSYSPTVMPLTPIANPGAIDYT